MTQLMSDEDLLILFDFEEENKCGWQDYGCDNKADWFLKTRCCNTDAFICDSHLKVLRNYYGGVVLGLCKYCRDYVDSFDQWIEVTKL